MLQNSSIGEPTRCIEPAIAVGVEVESNHASSPRAFSAAISGECQHDTSFFGPENINGDDWPAPVGQELDYVQGSAQQERRC